MQNHPNNSGSLPGLYQGETPIQYGSLPAGLASSDAVIQSIRLRRAGSELLCDTTKNFLRKFDSRKARRRRVQVADDNLILATTQKADETIFDEAEGISVNNNCILHIPTDPSLLIETEYPESPLQLDESSPAIKNSTQPFTQSSINSQIDDLIDKWQPQFRVEARTRPLASLSCGQLHMLRKLANIKLKTILEGYCPTYRNGWNWDIPKLKKRNKHSEYNEKKVFGIPLSILQDRNGFPLVPGLLYCMNWLRLNALEHIGLFRKSGVKSRIQRLKQMLENGDLQLDLAEHQSYDVADMIKQYFRQLPEALLTNKLSELLILIFQYVPTECRGEAVQWVLLLLPDENSEALQVLLDLLQEVASYSNVNQMTPSNLAVCLVPTLFHFRSNTNFVSNENGSPSLQDLADNRAAHKCLLYLILHNKQLFTITVDLVVQCHFNYLEDAVPVTLSNLGSNLKQDWRTYQESCMTALLKVGRESSYGWISLNNPYRPNIDIWHKKVGDEHPLDLWRVCGEVEAPPNEVMRCILNERTLWDKSCKSGHVIKRLDSESDLYQYVLTYSESIKPLYLRDFCVLRSWKTLVQKSACIIVETSVEYPDAPVTEGAVRSLILASRYLIEPCGSGKSRIMYLARMDIKGKSLEWYKHFGHLCGAHINRLCESFKRSNTNGPESIV